ncbi:Hpt domain-containing protein [Hyphomicrobium sp. NDB2Meth4]|uniref:Hpt domain-containing protein n=1 Tax=Hyphomicrobium sp. NDB2Meth4 TaxID=1892846 RepID=UPI000931E524|nr:Hpt domain-containing protein [Hyphomicrobium sp. NDB2Meth4]
MSLPENRMKTSAPVLDRGKLAELSALLGKDKFEITIQKFETDLEMRAAKVIAAATSQSDRISHAHKLVGTAGAIGFVELSEESRRLEEALKLGVGDVDRLIEEFADAAARARAALNGLR